MKAIKFLSAEDALHVSTVALTLPSPIDSGDLVGAMSNATRV